MKHPIISVLIPAFNEEENLVAAVESILKTKYYQLEIIIGIDDGIDRTLEIANELKKKHKNISIIYHKRRVGTTANMNSILRKATGEIILKFDADMRVSNPKNFFANIAKHFQDNKVGGIAIFGYRNVKEESLKKEIEERKRNIITRGEYVVYELGDMFKKKHLPLNKIPDFPMDIHCFRRSLIPSIESNVIHDDAYFAYKILEKGYTIDDGSDVVIIHLGTPSSVKGLSNTRIKGNVGWLELSKKYPINFKKYYFNLFLIFFKNIRKFGFYDVLSFFCWLIIFSISLIVSRFRKGRPTTAVWKKRI